MNDTNQIVVSVYPELRRHTISRYLYSHFIEHIGRCIYDGMCPDENAGLKTLCGVRVDMLDALKKLDIPAIRWPGGCFASNYHWMDGVGPKDTRPRRDAPAWDQVEPNTFGTDEFLQLCEYLGADPYIAVNVGSGTPEEAVNWTDYCLNKSGTKYSDLRRENGRKDPYSVPYWGVGNENWGGGGRMTPEYYADNYRRFASFLRRATKSKATLIACGSNVGNPEWDERFLASIASARNLVDCLSIHIYHRRYFYSHFPNRYNCLDIDFNEEDYYALIASIDWMKDYLMRCLAIAQAYSSPAHEIGIVLDEWGTWYRNANLSTRHFQQSTIRDAVYAAGVFHVFHECGERLKMTNIAQLVNILQALILTKGNDIVRTPTYYAYKLFKSHFDNDAVEFRVDNNPVLHLPHEKQTDTLSVSPSISPDGKTLFITAVNYDLQKDVFFTVNIADREGWECSSAQVIIAADVHDINDFGKEEKVSLSDYTGSCELGSPISISKHSVIGIRYTKF